MTDDPRHEQEHIQKNLAEPIRQIAGALVRGIMFSMPGWPPEKVANMIAWQVGNHLAGGFNGDMATMIALRANLKKSFEEGVAAAAQAEGKPKLVS